MKIYFGSAVTYGRKNLKNSKIIIETAEKLGHKLVSKHLLKPQLLIGEGLDSKELYRRETKKIDSADLMIAEVTLPSWGTAFLIEYALSQNKPVLALFYKDNGKDLPVMIDGHPELYKDYYTKDNIKIVLQKFLHFVRQKKDRKKGRLVVIDGSDGSGKATQADLLVKYLKEHNIGRKYIDFPRYYTSFHGKTVGRFLKGDFGSLSQTDPHLVSYIYALDRLSAKDDLQDWLEQGNIVVANRYTTSSMAFQSARVPENQRDKFISWLYELEYKQNRLPKEDIVIYLYVPVEISQRLLAKKTRVQSRRYMGTKDKDINEADLSYQKKTVNMYLQLAKKYSHWKIIDCTDEGKSILPKSKIHEKIIKVLQDQKIIKKNTSQR